jgi:hypothetical protein
MNEEHNKKQQVFDAISKMIEQKLFVYKNESINPLICLKIYQEIFSTFTEVLNNSKIQISNEALNYVAQLFYDMVKINNNKELDPNIFTQRASLDNVETKDLKIIITILKGSPVALIPFEELKKRG